VFDLVFIGNRGPQRPGIFQLRLCGNFSFPVLAFRRLDVGGHRRPAADDERPAVLLSFAVPQRILVCATRESLRQVRRSIITRTVQPVVTCRQSPYVHKPAIGKLLTTPSQPQIRHPLPSPQRYRYIPELICEINSTCSIECRLLRRNTGWQTWCGYVHSSPPYSDAPGCLRGTGVDLSPWLADIAGGLGDQSPHALGYSGRGLVESQGTKSLRS